MTAVAACGQPGTDVASAGSERGAPNREAPRGNTASASNLTLYLSNQSFAEPKVGITLTIDGVVVVDGDFDVEGQHNWIRFQPDVVPGHHILHVVSSTGAELTTELTIPYGEPRWAVIDYWFHPDDGPRRFTFRVSDEPIAFA